MRAFNVQVFHAFESEIVEVVTAARTQPFFGERRVVVLRDIEKTRLDQAGRGELLGEYLAAPSPETVFVVTTEDDAKAKALGKQYGGAWAVVVFNPLKGEALAGRGAGARPRASGARSTPAAVAALIEVAGEDQARVFNELAKLRSAVGAGGAIDERGGGALRRRVRPPRALRHRRRDQPPRPARQPAPDRRGHDQGRGVPRPARDARQAAAGALVPRRRRRARCRRSSTSSRSQLDKLRPDARRFTRAEIERGLQGLALLDERVKSTAVAPKLLLEHFLLGFLPPVSPGGGRP